MTDLRICSVRITSSWMSESLPLGVDFVERLGAGSRTNGCRARSDRPRLVGRADEAGARRLDDPGDFVRIEVAAALRAGVRVIPVLVDGAQMPRSHGLPEDLKPLARRHALVFQRHGGAAMRDLIAAIRQAAIERAAQEAAARTAAEREHAVQERAHRETDEQTPREAAEQAQREGAEGSERAAAASAATSDGMASTRRPGMRLPGTGRQTAGRLN